MSGLTNGNKTMYSYSYFNLIKKITWMLRVTGSRTRSSIMGRTIATGSRLKNGKYEDSYLHDRLIIGLSLGYGSCRQTYKSRYLGLLMLFLCGNVFLGGFGTHQSHLCTAVSKCSSVTIGILEHDGNPVPDPTIRKATHRFRRRSIVGEREREGEWLFSAKNCFKVR